MKEKNPINLSPEFIILLDKIVEANPDFKNRTAVVRYAIRKYYDEIISKESETNVQINKIKNYKASYLNTIS